MLTEFQNSFTCRLNSKFQLFVSDVDSSHKCKTRNIFSLILYLRPAGRPASCYIFAYRIQIGLKFIFALSTLLLLSCRFNSHHPTRWTSTLSSCWRWQCELGMRQVRNSSSEMGRVFDARIDWSDVVLGQLSKESATPLLITAKHVSRVLEYMVNAALKWDNHIDAITLKSAKRLWFLGDRL